MKTDVKEKLVVIKLDETHNWSHGDAAKLAVMGRLFGVYVADLSRPIHCCELTASYELYFVETEFEGSAEWSALDDDNAREEIYDYITEGDIHTQSVCYVHCSTIDRLPVMERGLPESPGGGCVIDTGFDAEGLGVDVDDEDSVSRMMDDLIGEVRANPF